jgi:endonuclease/exonuclease/phosphatase family metal-dependent hydrolase
MIKVASYNIRKGVGTDRIRSPDRILHVLNEIDADVIALQEADRRFGRRAAILAPHHLADHSPWKALPFGAKPLSSGWHGNVLLVRKEAEVMECAAIHLPTLEPRGAVMADIRLKGQTIRVVGMHLDLSGLMRRRQAAAIIGELDGCTGMPTVMMGDLNEWSRHSGCLQDFGERFAFAATGPSFHARRPIGRLDRIMASPDLAITGCGVHHSPASRTASDHLPIWATVTPA